MTRDDVQRWLDRYIEAWRSYDPDAIGDLFSSDVEYRFLPWQDPVVGRDALVSEWLDNKDEPGSWRAKYTAWASDGDRAVASGSSEYFTPDRTAIDRSFHNIFLIEFDGDGRARRFTELWGEVPKKQAGG